MGNGSSYLIILLAKLIIIDFRIPIFKTLANYSKAEFRSDLIAGITVGTILIPQAMAYALLAGVPPIYGLYTALVPLLIYAVFATSTKLSVGPVAVSALLVLAGISKIAIPGSIEYISYVIITGLLIGLAQIILGVLRMGFLVNFLSHPVIVGFTSAAAIIIVITQLKDALGLSMLNSADSLSTLTTVFKNLDSTNLLTLVICLVSLVVVVSLKRWRKKIPGPIIIAITGIVASYLLNFSSYGVEIIGQIPKGFPSFSIPPLSLEKLSLLWPTVLTVTLIGIVESLGITKSLESKHKDHVVVADKELIALGLSKVAGSFFQSIPSSGSFSRSAINSENGAKTTVASIFTVVMVCLTLLFFTPLFYYLPKAILAAIILLSVLSLFDLKEAKYLWKSNRTDFWMMAVTFILTLILGIEPGVACGVLLSILAVLYRNAVPTMTELRNIGGTSYYRCIDRFEQAESAANTIILRFENEIFFGNSNLFKEQVYSRIKTHHEPVKYVILDGSFINDIDSTGMHMLKDMDMDFKAQGMELHLAGAIGPVRDSLYKSGLLKEVDKHHVNVHAAITLIHSKSQLDIHSRPGNPLQTNES